MKKLFSVLGVLVLFVGLNSFSVNTPKGFDENIATRSGKACPNFNCDCCCEYGSGNCSPVVIITNKK